MREAKAALEASMGLRDWVSEKATVRAYPYFNRLGFNGAPRLGLGEGRCSLGRWPSTSRASMGLRDWVSEKGYRPSTWLASPGGFNGAPRLGLGEGRSRPCTRGRCR